MCAIGGGLAGLIVPMLTNGDNAIGGSAATGYGVLAIVAAVLMFGFQLFTIFGVQEKPLPKNLLKTPPLKLKDMFRVLIKNDQLLWCALVMLLFNVGTNVVGGGLGMMYVYFEFGYNGMLWTVFGLGFAVVSTVFTLFYPWLSKKYGRDNLLYSCGIAIIVGYGLMMILGLTVPNVLLFEVLGMPITLRFVLMLLAYTIAGWGGGFYMIMVINMANTVEYNEYKTGKREEGLIFSLRPFTAKMGSALMQGLVSLVYIIAGVVTLHQPAHGHRQRLGRRRHLRIRHCNGARRQQNQIARFHLRDTHGVPCGCAHHLQKEVLPQREEDVRNACRHRRTQRGSTYA